MFKLVIQDDEGKTTVVPLIRDEITIGRKEGNTIRLTERNVSRRHARIVRNNGEVQIEDLGSYNGIRVNNARIAERVSLRISDQVQIGDYKLYLKAEGVEQVDDARTMPIERLDSAKPTEVMPALPGAPTAPLPQQIAAAAAATRSQAAVADTDPAGRPVATAAQVAALTAPAGYGKLVVVSSNFAGKEFDLTRPQMIVGRTDENDLVINHRSISRNHAKVTRDPESNRYTISDLQSSNGVRVNGQDYGKVELRRGDVVDLGHVRLRFVEPGEDFVFARDAVIADVPETGGKRGLLVAIILAIVVLGGAAAFFLLGGKPKDPKGSDNGSQLLVKGSDQVASGSAAVEIKQVGSDPVVIDTPADAATATVTPPPDNEGAQIKIDCLQAKSDKNWPLLGTCADKLMPFDKDAAKGFKADQKAEMRNEGQQATMNAAIGENNLSKATKAYDAISDNSTYKLDAKAAYEPFKTKVIDDFKSNALALKHKNKCAELDTLIQQAKAQGQLVVDAIRGYKCEAVATGGGDHHPAGGGDHPAGTGSNGGGTPPPNCDPDALKAAAEQAENNGQHAAALDKFEALMRCKPDPRTLIMMFMESCNSSNVAKAKLDYKRLPTERQAYFSQMCSRNGIKPEVLTAP